MVLEAFLIGEVEVPAPAHPVLQFEFPGRLILRDDRFGRGGRLVDDELGAPSRFVEGGRHRDAGVGDGADLARFGLAARVG